MAVMQSYTVFRQKGTNNRSHQGLQLYSMPATTSVIQKGFRFLMPGESFIVTFYFPEKWEPFAGLVSYLVHSFCFKKPAVDHDFVNIPGIFDILQWIFVEDKKICEFPSFQRTDILPGTNVISGMDRCGF